MGAGFGKGVALAHGLPFVAVNHLEAHALTPRLPGLLPGGRRLSRTCCCCFRAGTASAWRWRGWARYRRLGTTLDDAVGEAFDKAAKLLGLPWPGGPQLERLAASGDPKRVPLPRPLLGPAGLRLLLLRPEDRGGAGDGAAHGRCRAGRLRRGLPGLGGRGAGRPRRATRSA